MYAYKSIVLSGNPGVGKSTLAAALSKEYGWPIYSIGGLWRKKYEESRPKGGVSFAEFWSMTSTKDNREVDERAKFIFELGNAIGDIRYTKNLNRSVCLLVFLTADIATRTLMARDRDEYRGMSALAIRKVLEKREKDEVKKGKELYGAGYDYRDPDNYHVVMNSSLLTTDQKLDAIRVLMKA